MISMPRSEHHTWNRISGTKGETRHHKILLIGSVSAKAERLTEDTYLKK